MVAVSSDPHGACRLAYPFYTVRSLIARYVLFALSFRYLMSAHHDFTFENSPIGMS